MARSECVTCLASFGRDEAPVHVRCGAPSLPAAPAHSCSQADVISRTLKDFRSRVQALTVEARAARARAPSHMPSVMHGY